MDAEVIIVGAGPVGLMLAAELRLHGVDVVVLDRLAEPSPFSRAFGLHARTAETMELRGLVERLRRAGAGPNPMLGGRVAGEIPLAHFAGIRTVRLDRLDTTRPGLLGVGQTAVEAVLAERATELGARILRGREVVAVDQDADGVTVTTAGGDTAGGRYLVGCDGGRSAVRKLSGFGFGGTDPAVTGRLAETTIPELMESPGVGWHRLPGGIVQVLPGRVLTVEFDGAPESAEPVTAAEMAGSISRVVGRDIAIEGEPTWLTRFTDNTRLAATYRRGRVLLAGDAAHVHSPFGGQGLNLGVQDAANLGWKLAAAVAGWAPPGLLDTYGEERRPVAARVLHNTRAQVALMNPDPRVTPLRELFTELMELEPVNRRLGGMLSGLEVRYDLPGDHPLTGAFVPGRLPEAARAGLRAGRAVLIDSTTDGDVGAVGDGWADRVDVRTAAPDDLPAARRHALLIRPDGYVAWAGSDADGARAALRAWFGAPRVLRELGAVG